MWIRGRRRALRGARGFGEVVGEVFVVWTALIMGSVVMTWSVILLRKRYVARESRASRWAARSASCEASVVDDGDAV